MLRTALAWFPSLFLTICLLALTKAAVAGQYNEVLSPGDAGPAWTDLPGVDGKQHSLADLKSKAVVVVVFTCNSCEYAQDYEDRIMAFWKKFAGPEGKVGLVAINVNKIEADSLPKMKERAEKRGFPFPYLYDETQKIAREYGAVFTPEFFVLDRDRNVVFMGGMDDHSNPEKVKNRYLEAAVESALKGETPARQEAESIGCRIRYARERKTK